MKCSVIGCGNMAGAIIGGLIAHGVLTPEEITASDLAPEARERLSDRYGISTIADNKECVKEADLVLLAVKPNVFPVVAEDIRDLVDGKIIVSIMAGRTLRHLEEALGNDKKIIRCMPNTPALVGAGITGYCPNGNVEAKDLECARRIIEGFSEAEQIPESLMAVVTSVSGSSPAFIYMLIEAMADGAVADGMPRKQAYHFAAQTVLGSAKMVLDTGLHPGELKDMVCSPGGTTIEGVTKLEEKGFRTAMIEAVRATTAKAKKME